MGKFLKENWYKILIAVFVFAIIGSVLYFSLPKTPKITNKSDETISGELTNEEINEISKSIVQLECFYDDNNDGYWEDEVYGSGIYISKNSIYGDDSKEEVFNYLNGYVLSNAHVAQLKRISAEGWNFNMCSIWFNENYEKNGTYLGFFSYDEKTHFLNNDIDAVLLKYAEKIHGKKVEEKPSIPDNILQSLLLKNYPVCSSEKIIGTKIYVFGYPSSAYEWETSEQRRERYVEHGWDTSILDKLGDYVSVTERNLIIFDGIISGKDSNGDFYTTAKIDAGVSGGLAVAKINGEICIVGIPTWLSGGTYENMGIIQSFEKIRRALTTPPL
ncbi:MAG: hypothetical protein Q8O13_00415 [Candidatus Omnitrophota bacterium]|nr:hypothetical protein [Candidatus Omnitrophota bacterium]